MAQKDPTYDEAQIAQKLKDLPGWWYEDGWIRRTYKTDGWPTTLMLVNAIGYFSEAAYHHPDLSVTWGRVIVKLQNHAAGGITDKDFELARKLEVLVGDPAGGVVLELHDHPAPRDRQVRMMVRRFGEVADRVHQHQRGRPAVRLVGPPDPAVLVPPPW